MSEKTDTRLLGDPFGRRSDAADPLNPVCQNVGVLARTPLFSGVSADDCARVVAAAHVKVFSRRDLLYIEEAPVREVFLLTAGLVKVMKIGVNGTVVILGLGMPGDILGVVNLLSTGRYSTTAAALRLCHALVWRASDFKALVESSAGLYQNVLRIQSEYLLEIEERFREIATEMVGPRVARQLLRLTEKLGGPPNGLVELTLSREEVAQMTGTNLYSISRLLVEWEDRGMVRSRREAVTICDLEALRLISEGF